MYDMVSTNHKRTFCTHSQWSGKYTHISILTALIKYWDSLYIKLIIIPLQQVGLSNFHFMLEVFQLNFVLCKLTWSNSLFLTSLSISDHWFVLFKCPGGITCWMFRLENNCVHSLYIFVSTLVTCCQNKRIKTLSTKLSA